MENLKKLTQWVVWAYTEDGRKIPRCPDNPSMYLRWSTSSFMTYEDASIADLRVEADGIGLIIPDGYYVIDLDHIRPGDPRAKSLIQYCNSYTEFSPSGKGIHIIVRADVPRTRNLTMGPRTKYPTKSGMVIELKRPGTFVTYTGKAIVNRPIKDCTELIRTTYEEVSGLDAALRANDVHCVEKDALASSTLAGSNAGKPDHYYKIALINECEVVRSASQGSRRNTLFNAARHLGRFHGKLNESAIRAELTKAAGGWGFSGDIVDSTISNGLAAA